MCMVLTLQYWLCSHENESRPEMTFWIVIQMNVIDSTDVSHALQTPSQSRSGSVHCEVIFLFLLRSPHWLTHAWLQHGFSAHFQNVARTNHVPKSFAYTCPRIRLSMRIMIQNAFFSRFKTRFKSLIWNSFAGTWAKIRLSNQEKAESHSETSFGMWF